MAKIFISYAQDGRDIASELKDSLESAGQHKVILHSSDNLIEEADVQAAIKACHLFVILVTEQSHDSPLAYKHFKLAEQSRKSILPIKIDSGLPPHLISYEAIELKGLDVTPVSREIELLALGIERRKERGFWRGFLILFILLGLFFSYFAFAPRVEDWVNVNFFPTETATPTATATTTNTPSPTNTTRPTDRPRPTNTRRPSATPISPSYTSDVGGELVFSRTTVDRMDLHEEDIFLLDVRTGEETQLTDNPEDDDFPVWSPDGLKIAFESNRDGDYEIFIMNADGSNQIAITDNSADERRPFWSPDGSRIAFQSNRDGEFEIYVMNVDGSNQEALTENLNANDMPTWSPDGSRIAFRSFRSVRAELYIINVDGTNETLLTDESIYDIGGMSWHPDGLSLIFSSLAQGDGYELFVVNADGTNLERITDSGQIDYHSPVWTPDGSQILFRRTGSMGNGDLWIMNRNGLNVHAITTTTRNEDFAQWRPILP